MNYIGFFIPKESGKYDIARMPTPFNDVCYDEFQRITDIVNKLQPIGMQYQSINLSHSAYKESVAELTDLYESSNLHKNTVIDSLNHVSLVANRILGVLTSASAFLTSTEIRIKKIFGKKSNELKSWNSLRNDLHKNSLAYRFMYELRNYSQHSNLPISRLSVKVDKNKAESQFIVQVSKCDLLQSGYDWGKYKEMVASLEELEDISPLLEEYVNICKQLFVYFLDLSSDSIDECGQYLEAMAATFKFPKGSIPVVFTDVAEHVDNNMHHIFIPFQNYQWLIELKKA
ncbi:hypothetical protein [Vibrio diabolicus]|uniref:hypothetical protein n=1 Tax=Vibrio diabolicus TaxID=50719 RepID=UPI00215E007C|nr:hypothetical protein [Vibrio diabolicus]MCS0388520.1 hypothetical protein [Vibrio diabolicus]